jgi:hypothetical protein
VTSNCGSRVVVIYLLAVRSPRGQRPSGLFQISALGVLQLLTCVASAADSFPHAGIHSDTIQAELYLPDAVNGYYRGTRFDWSGVIHSLKFQGHEYFGEWFEKHDPLVHDAITGPVNVFDTNGAGLGYAEAKPGGNFIRIGVGLLEKPDEPSYRGTHTYKIVNPGKWTVTRGGNWIDFVQELPDQIGYGYVYRKRITLTKGKSEMVLSYSLKNSGAKVIETTQFNHNFFVMDGQPSGPGFVARFRFQPRPTADLAGLAEVRGNEVHFLRRLVAQERFYTVLEGYAPAARDYDISIENQKVGTGVRITADRPFSKLILWSRPRVVGPEPYIALRIEPGETARWETRYSFYTIPKREGI